MLNNILRFLAAILAKLIFRLKVCGKKNIPKKGGFILASNHISYLDPIILGASCPRKLNFMAKSELFANPVFARFLFKIGVFPVKRKSADISAIKEAIRRVNAGKALLLFPEGSRRQNAEESQPQAGIGFLASKTDAPVIPVFVKGTDKVLPRGAKFPKPEKISVYFGKQIAIERQMPYQKIARQIMDNIRHLSC